MNLIDTYVSEVGRHLPQKSRADIEAEMRSVLEDMLDERSIKAGKPADDEMFFDLLKEYGAPEKVAASYLPERHLIGPQLFPLFMLVVKIVFSVLGIMALIGFGIAVATTGVTSQAFLELLGKSILQAVGGAIQVFGNIVLVFAILQRVLPASELKDEESREWEPRSLLKITPPDRVGIPRPVFEILLNFAAILVFNFYPQLFNLGFSADSVWFIASSEITKHQIGSAPLLSEAFFRYVPFLTVVWALEILLNILLLRQGYWRLATRWFSAAVKAAGVGIGAAMLFGASLIGLTPAMLTMFGSAAEAVIFSLNISARIVLAIIVVVEGIEIIQAIPHLIPKKKVTPIAPKA